MFVKNILLRIVQAFQAPNTDLCSYMYICTTADVAMSLCLVNDYHQYRKRQRSTAHEMSFLKYTYSCRVKCGSNPWLAKMYTHVFGKTFGGHATYMF